MTALQLAKRVIDHDGPGHYRDRAALSNSAHILFEQSSERDEEHIERPLHNTPDSIQQCSHLSLPALQSMPFSFNQFFYTPFNGWVIGITHSIDKEPVSIRQTTEGSAQCLFIQLHKVFFTVPSYSHYLRSRVNTHKLSVIHSKKWSRLNKN